MIERRRVKGTAIERRIRAALIRLAALTWRGAARREAAPAELSAIAEALAPLLAPLLAQAGASDYLQRHSAGLGPEEWRHLTREVPAHGGRRLLVKREDFRAWVEARQVQRGEQTPPRGGVDSRSDPTHCGAHRQVGCAEVRGGER